MRDGPVSSEMIRSQLSKHSPHGSQCGRSPVVPLSHWSHFSPVMPGSHSHRPVRRSHCCVAEPWRLHSHATHKYMLVCHIHATIQEETLNKWINEKINNKRIYLYTAAEHKTKRTVCDGKLLITMPMPEKCLLGKCCQ